MGQYNGHGQQYRGTVTFGDLTCEDLTAQTITVAPAADAVDVFNVNDADGNPVFTVDSTNNRINIGFGDGGAGAGDLLRISRPASGAVVLLDLPNSGSVM